MIPFGFDIHFPGFPDLNTSDRIFIALAVLFVVSQLRYQGKWKEIPHYFVTFILAVTLIFLRFDILWHDALVLMNWHYVFDGVMAHVGSGILISLSFLLGQGYQYFCRPALVKEKNVIVYVEVPQKEERDEEAEKKEKMIKQLPPNVSQEEPGWKWLEEGPEQEEDLGDIMDEEPEEIEEPKKKANRPRVKAKPKIKKIVVLSEAKSINRREGEEDAEVPSASPKVAAPKVKAKRHPFFAGNESDDIPIKATKRKPEDEN